MTINPSAIRTYITDNPTNERSMCLEYWYAAARFAGMPPYGVNLPNAQAAMAVSPDRVNAMPVAGHPAFLWFGTDIGYWDGTQCWFTDAETWTQVGSITIAQRLAALQAIHGTSDQYLGYTENLCGVALQEPSSGSVTTVSPTTTTSHARKSSLMAYPYMFRADTNDSVTLAIDSETGHDIDSTTWGNPDTYKALAALFGTVQNVGAPVAAALRKGMTMR